MKEISFAFVVVLTVIFFSPLALSFGNNRYDYYRVFITNESYNGNLGGLIGADKICTRSAHLAGLGGKWKAWLSDSQVSASERLHHSKIPYRLLNGKLVARNWRDLTTEKNNWIYLRSSINVNEFRDKITVSNVITGTKPNGNSFSNNPALFCMDYRDNCSNGKTWCNALFGTSNLRDADWTFSEQEGCNERYHLYCFEEA